MSNERWSMYIVVVEEQSLKAAHLNNSEKGRFKMNSTKMTDLFRPLEYINRTPRPAHAVNAEDVTGHRVEVWQ